MTDTLVKRLRELFDNTEISAPKREAVLAINCEKAADALEAAQHRRGEND